MSAFTFVVSPKCKYPLLTPNPQASIKGCKVGSTTPLVETLALKANWHNWNISLERATVSPEFNFEISESGSQGDAILL